MKKRKARRIAKYKEETRKLRERDPLEKTEKWIKDYEFLLKITKRINPYPEIINDIESTLKKLYEKKKVLENEKEEGK